MDDHQVLIIKIYYTAQLMWFIPPEILSLESRMQYIGQVPEKLGLPYLSSDQCGSCVSTNQDLKITKQTQVIPITITSL